MKKVLLKNKIILCSIFCVSTVLVSLLTAGCSEKKETKKTMSRTVAVFKTEPAGAEIFIAGRTLKNMTPCECPVANPGEYVVKFSLPGYKTMWKKAEFKGGKKTEVFASLVPVRSSILIAAKANGKYGVRVNYQGKFMGETPLVLRDLPAGKGEVTLSKRGFSSQRVFFTITDLLPPPAITADLSSNVGRLSVASIPEGATVRINGEDAGSTPLKMSLEDGNHKLEIVKNGYVTHVQDITISRDRETRVPVVRLRAQPATLHVNSTPAGGKLFINGVPRGDANGEPITLSAGKHSVRVSKDGFDDAVDEIVLTGGETRRLNLKLDTVMGGLEIITRPAGVVVFVDGKLIGRSKADPDNPKISQVISVPNMRQGKHTVTISHKRARRPASGRLTVSVNVKKGQVTRVDQIGLWVPDVKIILKSGRVVEGIFVEKTPEGIRCEFRPGARYVYKHSLVERMEKLPVEDD